MLRISDSILVGFDYSDDEDITVLTVAKTDGKHISVINTLTGDEAIELYNKLGGACIIKTKKEKTPC
jgi:hypothetical protein